MSSRNSQQSRRPPQSAPNFIENPLNIIGVILVPVIAGLLVFILGPDLGFEETPAFLEKIPTPWTWLNSWFR